MNIHKIKIPSSDEIYKRLKVEAGLDEHEEEDKYDAVRFNIYFDGAEWMRNCILNQLYDLKIEEWHQSQEKNDGISLSDYLGMTIDEYVIFLCTPNEYYNKKYDGC